MPKIELTINGEVFPCRQTMGAMLRFKELTGKEVTDINGFSDLCTYLYCCIKSASAKDGKEFSMSLMDFADSVTPEEMRAWAVAIEATNAEKSPDSDDQKKSFG